MMIIKSLSLQSIVLFLLAAGSKGWHRDSIFQGMTRIPAGRLHKADLCPKEKLKKFTAPTFDRKSLEIEDQINEKAGLPVRYATVNYVSDPSYSSDEATWELLTDGTRVWRMFVEASAENQAHHDCLNLNFAFANYYMPEGADLTIYDSDTGVSIGPFTHNHNTDHGELWTPIIPSCSVIIEVDVPPLVSTEEVSLQLVSVNEGYKNFGESDDTARRLQLEHDFNQNHSLPFDEIIDRDLAGYCNVDVACEPDWEREGRAVAAISLGGGLFCTGFMVNNARQDLKPYFMTAAHCGLNNGNAASLVVYWNWKYDKCAGGRRSNLDTYTTGSTHKKNYNPSDATLVELNSNPDPSWGVTYAGWDRSGADLSSAIAIHHPRVDDGMKISFENDATLTTSYGGSFSGGDGSHIRVADWDSGTTEPGSSGSPLFNANHQVVGQLHGGSAACGNNLPDWYGKFSYSMDQGGFDEWLDPDNTGVLAVDTIEFTTGCTDNSDCDDGIACTVDTCNTITGVCIHTPNDSLCDDGFFCNGEETCTVEGCQVGTSPCDDGIACTEDTCDEGSDSCTNAPNDEYCDDSIFCNGPETCSTSEGCKAGTNPCLALGFTCQESTNTCVDTSACAIVEDFDGGVVGTTPWSTDGSTCSTGTFEVGTPTEIFTSSFGVRTQVGGDHTTGSGFALYSSPNSNEYNNDIDGGACIATSPSYQVEVESMLSIWYFFGQRDPGDDPQDGFRLEALVEEEGGSTYTITLAEYFDVRVDAEWTNAITIVPAKSSVRVRMWASDAAGAGDLIEAGVDDLSICALESTSVSPLPTTIPSVLPSQYPSRVPSLSPSVQPSNSPNSSPSILPSFSSEPSSLPTELSSNAPSTSISPSVSNAPTGVPSIVPSNMPSSSPSALPSAIPSQFPSTAPSTKPSPLSLECSVIEDFDSKLSGSAPWNTEGSTCRTGSFVIGTPIETVRSNTKLQVGGDHTTATKSDPGSGHALFSSPNQFGSAGRGDIDRGSCIAVSPTYRVDVESTLTIWYFFGQRDIGDDAEDGFELEVLVDEDLGGASTVNLVSYGDERVNAEWTMVSTTVPAKSNVRVRMKATDGRSGSDIIEAGLDDLSICPLP